MNEILFNNNKSSHYSQKFYFFFFFEIFLKYLCSILLCEDVHRAIKNGFKGNGADEHSFRSMYVVCITLFRKKEDQDE